MQTQASSRAGRRAGPLTRADVLSRGARAGLALTLGGAALTRLTADASAAPLPDDDLAYVRLLVAAELLAIDFYSRAIASSRIAGSALAGMKHALANEKVHYRSLSTVLAGAGQAAATSDDIDFTYPRRTFSSAASIGKLGIELETMLAGAYLGAVAGLRSDTLRQPFAQVAANEAQHLSVLSGRWLGRPLGKAFVPSSTMEEVSDALDAFES